MINSYFLRWFLHESILYITKIPSIELVNHAETSVIPPDYLLLVENKIIKVNHVNETKLRPCDINKRLWITFSRWLGMKEPIVRRDVRRHLSFKWINSKDFTKP